MWAKNLIGLLLVLILVALTGTQLCALPLGTNITISDGRSSNTNAWYGTKEDQEVEPGCVTGQQWDLEGFFLDGNKLSMVGGFNFVAGEQDPYRPSVAPYQSGDIFIDVKGTSFTYDYVLDLNFSDLSYNLVKLNSASTFSPVYFIENADSNPWRYLSGGEGVASGLPFSYQTGLNDVQIGYSLTGGTHNVASGFDLAFLPAGTEFSAHFTMGCGNDNLVGSGTTSVPEPATILLLGSGLLGLVGVRRKFKK